MAKYLWYDQLCSEWYSDGVLWLSVYSECYSDGVLWLSVYSEWYCDGVLWLSLYKNWDSRTVGHAAGQVHFRPSGFEVILQFVIVLYLEKLIMKTHTFPPWM